MQPTHAGWYWDPNGRPGLFRWWDGVIWTRHVTPDRTDPAPEPFQPAEPDADGVLWAGRVGFPAMPEPWRQCPAYPLPPANLMKPTVKTDFLTGSSPPSRPSSSTN